MSGDAHRAATPALPDRERRRFRQAGIGHRSHVLQLTRFDVLAEVADLDGARLLDVGAGLGDFYVYLRGRGIAVDYTGLELCEHFAVQARRRFRSDPRCRFLTGDVLDHPPGDIYDVVIASRMFAVETGHTLAKIPRTLERLFAHCRCAVAVNFLSERARRHARRGLYMSPERLFAQAQSLTQAVVLRHDYLPHDFTLYLYKQPTWPAAVALQATQRVAL
jgi:trans-aconitate methyltransferase